jgi:cellobiose transport system substrate-binding protein
VKFLTSQEGQVGAFKKVGALPSNPKALDDAAVLDAKNAYFSDAPTGKIFGDNAKALLPVYMGPRNQAVRTEVENAVRTVELGQRTADQGWQDAITKSKAAAAK